MDLGFEGIGQGVAPNNAMYPRKGDNFKTCGQTYALEFGCEDVGQGIAPKNAMDPKEETRHRI